MQDFSDMLLVGGHVTQKVCKDAINKTLKGCRCISEPKGHHQQLIGAIAGSKGCLTFIPRSNVDEVVSVTKVDLCIYLSPTWGIEEVRY
ncbi:hypothetical protein PAXRUDRAFT_149599 [Paxillus rubicundulus Ve08.2h10]|uniref:Uncharacterized protein n=1 Tax=Paxillus rubicundulus Ve08.2h10 TaxID=930991 RepID=A0A0D0D4E9_9AGAM|nr:hypothetical protein PAXRUDRAFT_149599 [Paxillus rubicundulus Ve08.2h10]